MNCKKCKAELSNDAKFCSNCGHVAEKENIENKITNIDFYYIPPVRFAILSTLTFGMYPIFWFYKNWQLIKKAEGTEISPLPRSFVVFYSLPFFEKVIDSAKKHGFKNFFSAGTLALIYILSFVGLRAVSQVDLSSNRIYMYLLVIFLGTLPLLYIQNVIKFNNSKINNKNSNKKFSKFEVLIILIGIAITFILSKPLDNAQKYGSFTEPPENTATTRFKSNPVEIQDNKDASNYTNKLPEKYEISVIQVGGVGSRVINQSAYTLDDRGEYLIPIEDYVSTSFNNPADLLWVYCKDGYTISDVSSPTGNEVGNVPDSGANLSIEEKYKNSINVKCVLNNTTKQ